MPDLNSPADWPILDLLRQLSLRLAGWVQAIFLEPTLPDLFWQVVAIVGALAIAWLFSRQIAPHTDRFVATRAAERLLILTRLRPLALPLLWMLLLWFAMLALHETEAPAKLVEIALSLIAAWVGVRLVSSFAASLFWSRVIAFGIVLAVALKAFGLWTVTLAILDQMALTIGAVRVSALGIIEATLILALFWWAAGIGARWLAVWADRLPGLSPSQRVLLGKLVHVLAWTVAVVAALHAVGLNLTTLAVFSGAVGLGIGFGLQKVFSNLISGVILLLDRSVKPGDVIAVGEHYGWINALGARYVSVVTRDGVEHLIPNEELISSRVENWSHSNNLLRLHAPIGISYAANLDQAMTLAVKAAGEVRRVLTDPPPRCLIMGFGDNSVDLELRFWINDPRFGLHNVRSEVLKQVWNAYHESGIEFPFPQRDLHLKSTQVLPVRVVDQP